jgi:hypothetical protein
MKSLVDELVLIYEHSIHLVKKGTEVGWQWTCLDNNVYFGICHAAQLISLDDAQELCTYIYSKIPDDSLYICKPIASCETKEEAIVMLNTRLEFLKNLQDELDYATTINKAD